MARLVVRTVVGSEHDQRVLIDLQFFEQVKNAPHVPVHPGDHGGLSLVLLGPILLFIDPVTGYLRSISEQTSAFVVGVGNG